MGSLKGPQTWAFRFSPPSGSTSACACAESFYWDWGEIWRLSAGDGSQEVPESAQRALWYGICCSLFGFGLDKDGSLRVVFLQAEGRSLFAFQSQFAGCSPGGWTVTNEPFLQIWPRAATRYLECSMVPWSCFRDWSQCGARGAATGSWSWLWKASMPRCLRPSCQPWQLDCRLAYLHQHLQTCMFVSKISISWTSLFLLKIWKHKYQSEEH